MNPQTAFELTDSAGIARFSYTGTNEGQDFVDATLSSLIDTATVTWTAPAGPPMIEIVSPADGSTIP